MKDTNAPAENLAGKKDMALVGSFSWIEWFSISLFLVWHLKVWQDETETDWNCWEECSSLSRGHEADGYGMKNFNFWELGLFIKNLLKENVQTSNFLKIIDLIQ